MLNHIRFEVGVNLFSLLLLMADVIAMCMVVDVKTTEADVIAYYIFYFMADVIANVFVADVTTTCYSMRRCLLMADVIAMYLVVDVKTTEAGVIAYFILFYWLMLLPICLWQML